jgi:hypothetical protein
MRAFEFLTEYRTKQYRDGSKSKPGWYEKAVQLKRDNPHMTAKEISRQVGSNPTSVLIWLIGKPDSRGNIYNDNPPFTEKDFPNYGSKKYFDGAKPWWYEQAVAMRKQGMSYQAISNKLSTPEEKVSPYTTVDWLTKGRKHRSGKLVNPDAPFTPRPYNTTKIDTTEIEELILAKIDDADIIKYIRDEKGDKIAGEVRAMLPQLRQKLNPGTSVIDKTRTGNSKDPNITGFVQENFSD